jgi:hypothetical protein
MTQKEKESKGVTDSAPPKYSSAMRCVDDRQEL